LIEHLNSRREDVVSIDARRLAPFDGTRCLDVDVLYDLMIHDVDLALEIANSPVVRVSASGRSVFSDRSDVAHALIEFENQVSAVFWTARCSPRRLRSITVTTPSRYIVADTITRSVTAFSAQQVPSPDKGLCSMGKISREEIGVQDDEPLRRELEDFFRSIREGTRPLVDGQRALRAMKVLELIAGSIERGSDIRRCL
jgi:virulence factor